MNQNINSQYDRVNTIQNPDQINKDRMIQQNIIQRDRQSPSTDNRNTSSPLDMAASKSQERLQHMNPSDISKYFVNTDQRLDMNDIMERPYTKKPLTLVPGYGRHDANPTTLKNLIFVQETKNNH